MIIIKQLEIGYMENFCYVVGCQSTRKALVIDPGAGKGIFFRATPYLSGTADEPISPEVIARRWENPSDA